MMPITPNFFLGPLNAIGRDTVTLNIVISLYWVLSWEADNYKQVLEKVYFITVSYEY